MNKYPGFGLELGEILSALKAHGYQGVKHPDKPIWRLTKEGKSANLQLVFLSQTREWVVIGSNCHITKFRQLVEFTVRRVRANNAFTQAS